MTMSETVIDSVLAGELSVQWQLAASFIGILAIAWVMQKISPNALATFPHVGKGSLSARRKQFAAGAAWDLYLEGYRMVSSDFQAFWATASIIDSLVDEKRS